MALQFIFGSSGSGKSHSLYKKTIEEAAMHPEKNYIVLVPEQFTMQTQKDLVMAQPNHAILNIDVLSFGRLAYRVMEETGGNNRIVLDDEGKNLILRKIAGDYEEELTVLRGNLKKQGYISEVKSVISEFTQYDIGEEEIDSMMKEAGEGTFLYYKLSDIRKVYHGFYRYLEENYITKEEILDLLCERIPDSSMLKGSILVMDGFTGFTPVQNRLMREFLKICEEVKISVTIPPEEDPYVYKGPYQLFSLSKEMTTKLLKICKEEKVEVKEAEVLNGRIPYRFRNNAPLAFLESHLFRYKREIYKEEQEQIQIHCAVSPKQEVEFVSGEIRRLIREKGYRFREIALIMSDPDTYADDIGTVFAGCDIPVFMDRKRSVLLNPFVDYVRSVVAMVQKGFTYESVFRFLRTNLTGFTFEEVDELENYVIALGIRGYKKWQEVWVRKMRGMDEEGLQRVNHLRVRFVEKIQDLSFVLRQPRKNVLDITRALYEFLVKEEMERKVKEQEKRFEKQGQLALSKEYSQVYRIVMELFDKFVSLLGEERVSLEEYCNLLDAGLQEAKVGVIPPGTDEVMAGDLERTRLKDVKVVFFLGVNDTFLPGKQKAGGLLSEYDREKIKESGTELSAGGKEKTYIQKFYLYMLLTKPSDRLYLTYAKVSADGKSLRPAYLIRDLRKLFLHMPIYMEENRMLEEKELTRATAMQALIEGMKEDNAMEDAGWKELYTWCKKDDVLASAVENVVDAHFYRMKEERISRKAAQLLYQEGINSGVTRLERYAACAFAHFMAYGLRLNERQEYEFKPLDWGNIFHRAMERFAKKADKLEIPVTEIGDELRSRLVNECVEESIVDYENTVLYSTKRREYMITRMKRLVDRTVWALLKQQTHGDFIQTGAEVKFEGGKIDRIETCEESDKIYVKVTDYKTGSKAFDLTSFYYGIQLQLAVYMNAALEMEKKKHPGKEVIPAGIFYYKMQDPVIEKTDKESAQEKILKELRPDGLLNGDPEVLKHFDKNVQGSSIVAPFGLNKDGSLSKVSKAVSQSDFALLSRYTKKKTEKLKEEIMQGGTEKNPYELGMHNGCEYCPYRNICGFDEAVKGCDYRSMDSMKRDMIFQMIQRELEEEEGEE